MDRVCSHVKQTQASPLTSRYHCESDFTPLIDTTFLLIRYLFRSFRDCPNTNTV